jgi:hypothetical protein
MITLRETHNIRPHFIAECRGSERDGRSCSWGPHYTRNAQGLAAQHHDKTGHTVRVEIERTVYYGPIR